MSNAVVGDFSRFAFKNKRIRNYILGFIMMVALAMGMLSFKTLSANSVPPTHEEGNPSCVSLGYAAGFKPFSGNVGGLEANPSGTFNVAGGSITVTENSNGNGISWSSTFGIDAVIVKGGPNANVYVYDPPAESTGDIGLVTPFNSGSNQLYGLSHVEFCYDYEVQIAKTAVATFDREWDWTIEKECDQTELTLSTGQAFTVNCEVDVDADSTDGNFAVAGTVTITNPDPGNDANITAVSDIMTNHGAVALDCEVAFPYLLDSGDSFDCTYDVNVSNATDRTNTVTVTTTGDVEGNTHTVNVDFGLPTTETDECIDVDDSLYGVLGTVCAEDAPKTFNYSLDVGPYRVCGNRNFVNTATFTTNDTQTTDNDSHTIAVTVPCVLGCTLTQGYWKTHSDRGPAPYDNNWANLSGLQEDTVFFSSGKTWYQVFWTAPAGNAYYNLAHQYMAARLNVLNGASVPANVQTALNSATSLFGTYTPAQIAALKGNNPVRQQFISLAGILGSYNQGQIGPGHCSE
jgi:VCBS repeat-containing protein